MLVNKQLGYKNNSNLANDVEIDEGYRQKKNYSFKSLFSLFSYEMFGCLFTKPYRRGYDYTDTLLTGGIILLGRDHLT